MTNDTNTHPNPTTNPTTEPQHLWTGDFLDSKLTLVGMRVQPIDYRITFVLNSKANDLTYEGSMLLHLADFNSSDELISKALKIVEDNYITRVAELLAEEVKNGQLPH